MLKSTSGIPDVLPMFAKSGHGSPGRLNSGPASLNPLSASTNFAASSLVPSSQVTLATTASIVGHSRGSRLGPDIQVPTHHSSVKDTGGHHQHRLGAHNHASYGASHYFVHPNQHRDTHSHPPTNQHASHNTTYSNLRSYQHNPTSHYQANPIVSAQGVSRLHIPNQLQDFMIKQWIQFKSRPNYTASDDSRAPFPRTPTPTGMPYKEDGATPPSPASTPTSQHSTNSANRSPVTSHPPGSSTEHAGNSHSLPRRQPSQHYDGPALIDSVPVSWNHRRRGGPMGPVYRHPSSDGSTWLRGQAIVRKTSSPTTTPNRGSGVFMQNRTAPIGQSVTNTNSNNNSNSTSTGSALPVTVNCVSSANNTAEVPVQSLAICNSPNSEVTPEPSIASDTLKQKVALGALTTVADSSDALFESQLIGEKEGNPVSTKTEASTSNGIQALISNPVPVTPNHSNCHPLSKVTQTGLAQGLLVTVTQQKSSSEESFANNSSELSPTEFPGENPLVGAASEDSQFSADESGNSVTALMSVNVTSLPPAKQRDRADTPTASEQYWTPDPPSSPANGNLSLVGSVSNSVQHLSLRDNKTPPTESIVGPFESPELNSPSATTAFTPNGSTPCTPPSRAHLESINDVD